MAKKKLFGRKVLDGKVQKGLWYGAVICKDRADALDFVKTAGLKKEDEEYIFIEEANSRKQNIVMFACKFFECEICHKKFPYFLEGSEPNTCAECMSINDYLE